jgi:hypothetical protein
MIIFHSCREESSMIRSISSKRNMVLRILRADLERWEICRFKLDDFAQKQWKRRHNFEIQACAAAKMTALIQDSSAFPVSMARFTGNERPDDLSSPAKDQRRARASKIIFTAFPIQRSSKEILLLSPSPNTC